jgi:thiol-disulfide isomerase/thioredoxin
MTLFRFCRLWISRQASQLPLILTGVILLSGCSETVDNSAKTPVVSQPPQTSLPMPPLSGKSINNLGWEQSDGYRREFSAYRGKVLVLDFYATWCLPCRDSVPHLIELQQKFESQGLAVVGLNVGGPGDKERVSDFARELGIQYPLGMPDQELVNLLLSMDTTIPQTFVFDRHGQLVERLIGFGPSTSARITEVVETALKTGTK